jgi:protocatechuate 3,4-dioxygenase beta subunit
MRHSLESQRGNSSRAVLLVLALLAVVIGLVTYFALRGGGGPAAVADARPNAPRHDEAPQPANIDSSRVDSLAAKIAALPDGIPIPAGVRLGGPGRLVGRVLDRTSGNGVAGARVDLLPLPPAGQELFGRILRLANTGEEFSSRVESIAITGTGIDGSFAFEGVRTGTYFIEARAARCVPDSVARARVAASGDGGPIDVWVRPGGRVLGVVLLPSGEPAAEVKVALTQGPGLIIESAREGDACYLSTKTDAAGAFVIAGVPPGDGYDLTAIGSGFAITHALDLIVRAGEDTQVTVRTSLGATIEGRVVSTANLEQVEGAEDKVKSKGPIPLAGAHVGLVARGLRDLAFAEELLEESHVVTGADGRFVMQHVPPGELDLIGVAPGHLPAKGPRALAGQAGLVVVADFELPRGPMVSGRVVDAAGQPIEGVTVRWNSVDFRNFQFDFSFAPLLTQAIKGFEFPKTDAEGRFTAGAFPGEPPFRIDFFKSGFENTNHRWEPAKEKEGIEVVMHRGGSVEGIVMDSTKRVPVTSFTIETTDRIETQAAAPGTMNPFSGGQLVEDPKGRFKLEPVKVGKVDLTFKARGYIDTTLSDLEVAEGAALRGVIVELKPGATLRGSVVDSDGKPVAGAQVFAMPEAQAKRGGRGGGLFGGRGLRRGGFDLGELPAGFRDFAAALGLLGDRAVLSAPDGHFELIGLAPGATVALAAHRSYVIGRSEPVTLTVEGPAPEVEIELSKGSGVYGHAKDRFGRPVAGAIVIAASPANLAGEGTSNGGGLYQGRTNELGAYRIERMVAGGYFVVLTRGDAALNPMSFLGTLNFDLVTVPADEPVEYDIVDTSSGATRVFGSVLAKSLPVGRGNVTALGFESENMLGVDVKIAQIHDDGSYEFSGLAPGEYQFNVDNVRIGDRNVRAKITAEIPDVPEFRLDLRMPEGALTGRVVDAATGDGVAWADVTLRRSEQVESGGWLGKLISQESGQERTSCDDKGEFRFERLAAGTYELTVRPQPDKDGVRAYATSNPISVEIQGDATTGGVEVKLMPALALAGRVIDERGAGVADAVLLATRVDQPNSAPERAGTDADGAFKFGALASGAYDISASADGFASTTKRSVVVDLEHRDAVEITLPRGVEVSVKVLGPDGQPVTGATGRLVRAGETQPVNGADVGRAFTNLFSGKGVSDSKGVLELGKFEPGAYRLEVQRGQQRAQEDVKIDAGGPIELRVRLR